MPKDDGVMQNFVDSFCQCFSPAVPVHFHTGRTQQQPQHGTNTAASTAAAAATELQRRTRSLSLKDKAWDPLFEEQAPHHRRGVSLEHAQAAARAKLASQVELKTAITKRKRARSKDDIFRNKKTAPPEHPFSRFLSNHPVVMRSLCFATPIRGSEDEEYDDAASVVSDSNTLNTAEDTITSTLYYERTKLAGLEQKSPPMPLFHSQSVNDVAQLNTARSRSSQTPPPPVAHVSSDDSSSTAAL
jgi:hypothetical protein